MPRRSEIPRRSSADDALAQLHRDFPTAPLDVHDKHGVQVALEDELALLLANAFDFKPDEFSLNLRIVWMFAACFFPAWAQLDSSEMPNNLVFLTLCVSAYCFLSWGYWFYVYFVEGNPTYRSSNGPTNFYSNVDFESLTWKVKKVADTLENRKNNGLKAPEFEVKFTSLITIDGQLDRARIAKLVGELAAAAAA